MPGATNWLKPVIKVRNCSLGATTQHGKSKCQLALLNYRRTQEDGALIPNCLTRQSCLGGLLETKEALQRKRIEERGKTSESLLAAGVLPTTKSVRLTNYFDSAAKRPRPDTSVYQADEIINVFDATGFCIGRIEEGRFKWKYDYQSNICEGVQNVESINRSKKS